MFEAAAELVSDALGLALESSELSAGQMALRAAVVFVLLLAFVRAADRRFLGKSAPFDVLLAMLLGSMASRAITGNAPFVPTLTATALLILLHLAIASIALRWHGFGMLVKGDRKVLVRDGRMVKGSMRKSEMTEDDLMEAVRINASTDELDRVATAYLERNGEVSVLKKPQVVELSVKKGVQTIRLELG